MHFSLILETSNPTTSPISIAYLSVASKCVILYNVPFPLKFIAQL